MCYEKLLRKAMELQHYIVCNTSENRKKVGENVKLVANPAYPHSCAIRWKVEGTKFDHKLHQLTYH